MEVLRMPDTWPELTLVAVLVFLVAYLVADFVARLVRSLLQSVIADSAIESLYVEQPRRIVAITVFLITAAALSFPALRLAGYPTMIGGSREAVARWLLEGGLRIAVIAILAYLVIRIGSAAGRRFEREMSHGSGLDVIERTKRARTLSRLIQRTLGIVVSAISLLMILRELRVDITPVLTGAGILGLAIGFRYDDDPDRAAEALRDAAESVMQDDRFRPSILEPLEILGVDAFGENQMVLKARIKTVPLKQWEVGRELRKRVAKIIRERGI